MHAQRQAIALLRERLHCGVELARLVEIDVEDGSKHLPGEIVEAFDLKDKTTPDIFDKFAAAVRRAPEMLECHRVAGGFDYLVKTRFADIAAYRAFLGNVLLALPGVKETRTYAVMEEVKTDQMLPV